MIYYALWRYLPNKDAQASHFILLADIIYTIVLNFD